MRLFIFLTFLFLGLSPIYAQSYQKILDKISKYEQEKNLEKCKKALDQAVKKYPYIAEVQFAMAKYQNKYGDEAKALPFLQKAINISPDVRYFDYRARLYLGKRKDISRAKADFQKILELEPNNFDGFFGLGKCFVLERNTEKIKDILGKIKLKRSENPSISYQMDFEELLVSLKKIEQERKDSLLLSEIKSGSSLSDLEIRSTINYKFYKEEEFEYAEWNNAFPTLSEITYINDNQNLKILGNKETVMKLPVSEFYTRSGSFSNFLGLVDDSGQIKIIDLTTRKYIKEVKLPNYKAIVVDLVGKYLFTSHVYQDNVYLSKIDILENKTIFTTNLGSGFRIINAFHTDGNQCKVITQISGRYLEIDETGKIIKSSEWPKVLTGKSGVKTLSGDQKMTFTQGGFMTVCMFDRRVVYLVDNEGNILVENQLNEKEWFISESTMNPREVVLHPNNHAVFIQTNYGIIIWHFLSNSFYLLDHTNDERSDRKKYKVAYPVDSDSKLYFDGEQNLISITKKRRLYYQKSENLDNPELHQNFLQPAQDEYSGETKSGVPHGRGIMLYANNSRYEGEFKNGKPNGTGIMYYNNANFGYAYEGEWVDGKREGKGILYMVRTEDLSNADRYDCYWANDKKNGPGYYIKYNYFGSKDKNGKFEVSYIFRGHWLEDKKHGKAEVYTTKRSSMLSDIHSRWLWEAEYNNDKLISEKIIAEDVLWKRFLFGEESSGNSNNNYSFSEGEEYAYISKSYEGENWTKKIVSIAVTDGGLISPNLCKDAYLVKFTDRYGKTKSTTDPYNDSTFDMGVNELAYPITLSLVYKTSCSSKSRSIKVKFNTPGVYNIKLREY